MLTRNHISVEIDADFGSQFQEEAALRALENLLLGWSQFWQSKHAKTRIQHRIIKVESLTNRKSREAVHHQH